MTEGWRGSNCYHFKIRMTKKGRISGHKALLTRMLKKRKLLVIQHLSCHILYLRFGWHIL